MSDSSSGEGEYILYGMLSSYFTKKLESYLRAKGIPYRYVELDTPAYQHCAVKMGVMQIPYLQCPDGTWLTDTTPIIEHFEADPSLPTLTPQQPATAYLSYFLEDCFDEYLWAPALYYRWAFAMDHLRRSEEFSHTLLSQGLPLPRSLTKKWVTWRQREVHLKDNGIVSKAHARYIEQLYLDLLDLLQPVFAARPYLFGDRPCEADFGLFGPMFPHFACDPTPQEIMHVRAPHLFRWVGRLWSTQPEEVSAAPALGSVPADLTPLLQKMGREYLPYLVANQQAYQSGSEYATYRLGGLDWQIKTAPYRVYCLAQLQKRFQALGQDDQQLCRSMLGEEATAILCQPINCPPEMDAVTATQPANANLRRPVGRQWQAQTGFLEKMIGRLTKNKASLAVPETKREGTQWLPLYFRRYRAAE